MLLKRKLKYIISLLLVFTICIFNLGCGCKVTKKEIEATFISGKYLVYYDGYKKEREDFYYIVGQTKEELPSSFYLPDVFNGKLVKHIGFGTGGEGPFSFTEELGLWTPSFNGVEKLYIPYTISNPFTNAFEPALSIKEVYASAIINISNFIFAPLSRLSDESTIYVSKKVYDLLNPYISPYGVLNKLNDYVSFKERDVIIFIQAANTTFMFNYENSPNEDIFFINDFERGGVIEDVPYKPIREGYDFAGWYKEPECINKWNFETDTLPPAQYDENNELIFVETKLYAKWI